ncbi:MAG TPA: DUF6308 family protein [Chloroflexia bacterium]|nr:DUF6308 family protein [Chloroflexia bacterium]
MAKNLWEQTDCTAWRDALAGYATVVAAQGVEGLEDLDAWYRTALPPLMAARRPPYVTREELVQVTSWKMKRGVWRARNRWLVAGNDAGAVEEASQAALAALPDVRRPLALLSGLAGVGPATASAVLAAVRPDLFPFFDELVADQIPGLGPVAFTAGYYHRYRDALVARAGELAAACPDRPWSAHDVGQALWAAAGGKAGR